MKEQSEVDKWNAKIENEEDVNGPRMTFYVERLKEANERLKEANERLQEAREYHLRLTQPLQTTKKQRIEEIDRSILTEYIALAQELSLEESEKLVAVPETIFRTLFANGLFIRQEYVNVVNIIAKNLACDKPCQRVLVIGSPGIGTVFDTPFFPTILTQ